MHISKTQQISGVWPIHVKVGPTYGYSLWGRTQASRDRVLCVDHKLILVRDLHDLLPVAVHSPNSNFRKFAGYSIALTAIQEGKFFSHGDVNKFDFNECEDLLALAPGTRLTLKRIGKIVDLGNMLMDMSNTLQDRELCQSFRKGAFVGEKLDELTFIGQESLSGAFPLRERKRLFVALSKLIKRLAGKVRVVSAPPSCAGEF